MNNGVQVREGVITLPTYTIKGENRNPVFRSQYGVAHIYPYTLQDDIDTKIQNVTYHTLVMENDYLQVTVISDLGGRVYSVFDKISEREVFYKNSTVRFAPLAIRGAFFSGGVEFSFPVAHAPTTCDKVNWDIRNNEDGSASVAFGGLEHISRLRWMITLTLYPDRCALAQDVYLCNPSTIPGRYHYWTNASLDANDSTEFIYPLHRARSYEYAGTASWPFARLDLIREDPGLPGMEGVPMWPANRLQAPINFRWQKNMLAQVSIFGRDVKWDYFGAWQHKVNHGYAHVANKQEVSGMKLWSWGNAPLGVENQSALTDDGSVYAETQCGAMETQLDFDFLQPGDARAWREWWIPLRGIGGLTCASETMGAKINLVPVEGSDSIKLEVRLCPAKKYDQANVKVTVPGKVLFDETFSVSPQEPWIYDTTIASSEIADKPLTLVVSDSLGNVILENTQNREPSQIEPYRLTENVHLETADDFYELGLRHENFDNREQAREAYETTLQLAMDHKEAHLRYGLMLLRSGQFEEADGHFSRAEGLGLLESGYYRGLIALYQGRWIEAENHFKLGLSSKSCSVASRMGLGKIALRKSNWDQAIELFDQACAQVPEAVAPSILLAIALRRAGKADEAQAKLMQVLSHDPFNHPALQEMVAGDFPESVEALQKLQRILADDDQYSVDLACYYLDAGLPEVSLEVLKTAWSQNANAMKTYLLAFISHQTGDASAEKAWLDKTLQVSLEYGFPSRLEEVAALEFALEQHPGDSKAKYFLGNFCYAHERHDEAVQLWNDAVKGMDPYDVLFRNLGLAEWQRNHNPSAAIGWFEKALALNPNNQDLYLLLDELYKIQNLEHKREQLLTKIKGLSDTREDVRKHSITMMVDLGHYKEAIELMTTQTFIPLEMDQSFHDVYVQALMMRTQDHLTARRLEDAIQDYHKMLEYPENLGVGAPTTRAQAHIYYRLGLAYEKLGNYHQAIKAWREAASEHHPRGNELYAYIQMALDKLSRYSELGLEE